MTLFTIEASIEQVELKEFLETGKELQVNGFEAYVAGVGESVEEDPVRYRDENDSTHDNRDNIMKEYIISHL